MDKEQLSVPEVSITHPLLSLHWEELPQLPWRMDRAKSVWHNGCLFVGGGDGVGLGVRRREHATLYVYSHQQWRMIDTPTYWYGMAVFRERITLVGGREYTSGDTTNKVWQLQSSHGEDGGEKWKDDAIPPMATQRLGASAVAHHNSLLVAGGYDGSNIVAIVEVFSSQLQQWLSTTSLPRPCSFMSSTVVGSHLVFAGGEEQGREVYRCSMEDILSSSLQWERLADLPLLNTSITTHNGVLLAIGGSDGSSERSAMFVFSVSTQRWRHFFDLPLPLYSTTTPTGNIIAIGGYSDSGYSSKVFKLYLQDEAALGLSNIILRGVQNGLLALVERALTAVKKHFHSSQQMDGSLLLDFLAHNSSPNVTSIEHSCSPLMIACANGDTKMVEVLLENGASPSYKNKDDVTAVHVACSKDNLKLVQQLVDSNGGLTHQATTNLLQMTDKDGQTVLHYSCSSRVGGETLKLLLKNKPLCDMLNKRTNTGLTPLLAACHHGNKAAVEVLLQHEQVDTAVCDEKDQGALHLAAQHDSPAIVELLLNRGCPSDAQDSEGNTALHIAYKKSSSSVITVLTDVDNGRVEVIMNKAGKLPTDIEPDDIIPPEIKKRGAEAVQLYLEALMDGRTKIPRCNLVILGQERVGKTSLYRLLVLKGFDPKQDSTRGIDNAIVEALDRRNVTAEDWSEKDDQMVQEHVDQQFVSGVIEALPSDLLTQSENAVDDGDAQSKSQAQNTTDKELYAELSKLEPRLRKVLKSKKSQPRVTKLKAPSKSNPPPTKRQVPTKARAVPSPHPSPSQPQLKDLAEAIDRDSPTPPPARKSIFKRLFKIGNKPSHQSQPPEDQVVHKSQISSTTNTNVQMKAADAAPLITVEEPPAHSTHSAQPAEAVSSRQALMINKQLVVGAPKKRVEPVLLLNTLDFAGQEEYRPMHHCFLTRRAVYLAVFNLQHIIHYLKQVRVSESLEITNPFVEIRYWLHSIHVHTLPAVSGQEVMSVKNVCLVGTHRDSPDGPNKRKRIEDEKLREINDLIWAEIREDDRCLKHLHLMGPDQQQVFLAVENSIDGKEEQYREASGAKALQREVKVMTDRLPFINEDFPVSWLNLEAKLVEWRKNLETEKSSLLVQLDQVLKLAAQCGIRGREGQLLALEFFHETGKIVYLKLLPRLFITDVQHAELEELVVLDPTWLIRVMQNVVELNYRSSIQNKHILQLSETGVAACDLLKKAWSGYLREPKEQSFHQFCLMLQAECLIHPIIINPKSTAEPLTTSPASKDEEQSYLIPGKLPDKIKEDPIECSRWVTFYFDFDKFLPDELYHRLVCLLLAEVQRHKFFRANKPYLSKRICQFRNFDDCHWSVEFEKSQHRLKISVLSSTNDPRQPTHHIRTIHMKYLQKICTLSNLEGLRYVGGPLLEHCEQCGNTGVVEYVRYFEGEDKQTKSECPNCLKGYDVNQLLLNTQGKNQRSVHNDSMTTAASQTAPQDETDAHQSQSSPPPDESEQTQEQPLTIHDEQLQAADVEATAHKQSDVPSDVPPLSQQVTIAQATGPSLLSSTPTYRDLIMMKWTNDEGKSERFELFSSVSHKWHKIGGLLGMDAGRLEGISLKHQRDPEPCCMEVLNKWLEDGSGHYPTTWDGLIELLEDGVLPQVAEKLKFALIRRVS